MPTKEPNDFALSFERYNELTAIWSAGDTPALEVELLRRQAEDPWTLHGVLDRALFEERAHAGFAMSEWMLANPKVLPSDADGIDLGLRQSVFRWRTDGIRAFLDLGADPNQVLVAERTALDVCVNRTAWFFSESKDSLEDAVAALRGAGGRGYLEHTLGNRVGDHRVFALLDGFDAWPKKLVNDLAELDAEDQNKWTDLVSHCSVKAKAPSMKWTKQLTTLLDGVDRDRLFDALVGWIELAREPRLSLIYGDLEGGPYYLASDSLKESQDLWGVSKKNAMVLKGLVWTLAAFGSAQARDAIAGLATAMYRAHYLLGVRETTLANACFETLLGLSGGGEAAQAVVDATEGKVARKKMAALLNKAGR